MPKLLLAAAAALALVLPSTALAGLTRNEASLLREMNRVRTQHGLGRLHYDGNLERAARSHSREMLGANLFEHGAFGTRMLRFNVAGSLAGENLAWGTGARGTARGIVVAWLASPEHRANLLRPSFSRIGIGDFVGAFQGHSGAHVVTADFAG
ncbi:MAG: CAP domain-containing protein [Gaiellaceae bacterium]